MGRRLFNVAALLSLLILAWACYAWVRSYQPRHLAVEAAQGRLYVIFWEGGSRPVPVEFWPGSSFATRAPELFQQVMNPSRRGRGWQGLGFAFAEGRTPSIPQIRMIAVPCWFIVVVMGVVPAAWLVGDARRRRRFANTAASDAGMTCAPAASGVPSVGRRPWCESHHEPHRAIGAAGGSGPDSGGEPSGVRTGWGGGAGRGVVMGDIRGSSWWRSSTVRWWDTSCSARSES